ncbi:hypothetical protein ACYYHG_000074 [Morganella morganii]
MKKLSIFNELINMACREHANKVGLFYMNGGSRKKEPMMPKYHRDRVLYRLAEIQDKWEYQ